MVYVNGSLAEQVDLPHPEEFRPDQIEELVARRHEQKKQEINSLLGAYRDAKIKGNADEMYELGVAFYYKGLFNESLELLEAVVAMRPGHDQAQNMIGQAFLSLRDAQAAVQAGKSAVGAKPTYADYRNNLGLSLVEAGLFGEAISEFKKALQINLYYSDAHFNLGQALIRSALDSRNTNLFADTVSQALDSFRKAAMINPEFNTAEFNEGLRILESSDLSGSAAAFERVKTKLNARRRQREAAFHMRHVLHPEFVSLETIKERIEYLEQELEQNPNYVDLYPQLARCYLEQARLCWENGMEQYRKTLEMNPSLDSIHDSLGESGKALDQIKDAINSISRKG
jgi:tetratricopeptide (TPR) repeat protein